eukprot:TRINITY_DN38839_c0_g1_i1.p1 TRINITY_DN38839_c0_g1~~TRINITY_DN38839_c0_g1_i1.p1  ORF type:complete len:333 (+),score=64.64 TRINITY_DN38839_c0_g1_i1:67-1065(+)
MKPWNATWQSGAPQFSDSAGKTRLYGALLDQRRLEDAQEADNLRRRRRLNCAPLFLLLLLPWVAFLLSFAAASFYFHYAAPMAFSCVVILCLVLGVERCLAARRASALGREDGLYKNYLAIALALAMLLGFAYGDFNFWTVMQPAYELSYMATYSNVDPSSRRLWTGEVLPTRGVRFQDAGAIYFNSNTIVDVNRTMSFKMGTLYCVAPILNPSCQKNCGYDFWAVGTDCCAEDASSFNCGDVSKPTAKSGLRMMDESQRSYFRLAVLEAEGSRKLVSPHPILLHWVQDPVAELQRMRTSGYRRFVAAMIFSFVASAGFLFLFMTNAHRGLK